MKVHELSKKTGKSNKQICEEWGLASHLSVVPENILEQILDSANSGNSIIDRIEKEEAEALKLAEEKRLKMLDEIDIVEKIEAVKAPIKQEPKKEVDPEYEKKKELSIRCLGNKSEYWGK